MEHVSYKGECSNAYQGIKKEELAWATYKTFRLLAISSLGNMMLLN